MIKDALLYKERQLCATAIAANAAERGHDKIKRKKTGPHRAGRKQRE
ncbi:hypothetical protein RNAN_3346 [Rheinheimera nanhaiensis E407-8]|uniref:Uncharacterized protein n=1 Tax=Rheinheimera nanhaiensis E407-8 TaxID=562729 RepID=I1E1Z6_9GAMM|nr:hypothetical protein RNAN_3346 [Rheinheimera nanhaiensis E407-8]